MASQAIAMCIECEWMEKSEDLRNQPLKQIIEEQNVPVPMERWSNSSIMLPTQYLDTMVYYFVFVEADPRRTVTNKGMAALFKLSLSNLHKVVSSK